MKLEKILVGVDFSEESDVAVTQALDLARSQGAELVLLHVGAVPDRPAGVPESMHDTVAEYQRILSEQLADDRRRLEDLRERIDSGSIDVSHVLIDGFPDHGIVSAAEEVGADLIVTGTHGRTGIKRFLLGSIAERVVRLAATSVMVARPGAQSQGGFRRILVATDFSPLADRALTMATTLAGAGARIDILHCWQLPAMSYTNYAPTKAARELVQPIKDSITASVEEHGQLLIDEHQRPGLQLSFSHVEAAPSKGIHDRLEDARYDLIVLGSHGRRGIRRFVLGSVAEVTVRHAPCSVLVVHGDDQADDERESDREKSATATEGGEQR